MRVTRRIVLHLLQKHSTSLAVIKKKFGLFQNFGSDNAANLLSCPETILHVYYSDLLHIKGGKIFENVDSTLIEEKRIATFRR